MISLYVPEVGLTYLLTYGATSASSWRLAAYTNTPSISGATVYGDLSISGIVASVPLTADGGVGIESGKAVKLFEQAILEHTDSGSGEVTVQGIAIIDSFLSELIALGGLDTPIPLTYEQFFRVTPRIVLQIP